VAGTPQQPPAVVLVGFMGAGKTVIGRGLADRLGIPFLDTDAAIVEAEGPITSIFEARGESGFRALEAQVVVRELDALARTPRVLALGGGAVLSDDVRRALRRAPHVVWLTAPRELLWARVAGEATRPLARDEESFSALLRAREPLYREVAGVTVDTSALDPGAAVDAVLAALASAPAGAAPGHPVREGGVA
jgi:shikimate kinase